MISTVLVAPPKSLGQTDILSGPEHSFVVGVPGSFVRPKGVDRVSTITADQAEKIKEIVCEILEIDEAELTEESLFADDHGADSLRSIEILAALEKEFGLVIDQAELSRMVNLKGVYDVVQDAAAAR
nr:acyl carrier protein [Planosporangium thailandense]